MAGKQKVKDIEKMFKIKAGSQIKTTPLKEGLNPNIRLVKDISDLEVEEKVVGKKQELYIYVPLYNEEGDYVEKIHLGTVTPNGVLILTEEYQQFKQMKKDKVYNIYVRGGGWLSKKRYTIREVIVDE